MAADRKDVPKIDSAELKELTEKLMTACHILDHEGVTDGYGHVSVRVPGADAFVTIANVSPGCVTRDRLIMQDLDGNYLDGAKTLGQCHRQSGFASPHQPADDQCERLVEFCRVMLREVQITSGALQFGFS